MEWNQKIGEKPEWYARFTKFLLKGPSRSVLSVYNDEKREQYKGRKAYVNKKGVPKAWHNQVKDFKWRERAAAFDTHCAQKEQADWVARQEEIRNKQFNLGMTMLERAQELADMPVVNEVTAAHPETGTPMQIKTPIKGVTVNTAVTFGSEGARLARKAAEMDPEAKEINLRLSRGNGLALPSGNGDPPQSNMEWLKQYRKRQLIQVEQVEREPTNGQEKGNGQHAADE